MRYPETEFETLYRQCFPPSMRLAMSLLHDEDEARDAVQEVFLKILESGIRIENPMALILRSVRNACLNRLSRLDTREKIRQRLTLHPPADETDPELPHEEVLSAVRNLLTERERQTIYRVYSDGMSYKEASQDLGVSTATINKHIVTALRKLRDHFKTRKS